MGHVMGQVEDEWLSTKNIPGACHTPTEPICGQIKQDMETLMVQGLGTLSEPKYMGGLGVWGHNHLESADSKR